MRMHVIAVGRLRDPALQAACDTYVKRLRSRLSLAIVEVRDAGRRGPSAKESRRIEAEALEDALPDRAQSVALTRTGEQWTSRELAKRLETWRQSGRDVAFVIGGAFGLAPRLIDACDLALSLSPMTLPHELARLVLLEQLYRADSILRGEPYHKEGD